MTTSTFCKAATIILWAACFVPSQTKAQMAMPPKIPIWDANLVTLKAKKIADNVYAVMPSTAETETSRGIPQATTAGFIVGDKGVLLIETMLSKRLYDQLIQLVRSVTSKPIAFAVNTSDHGDHCFGNYLLPEQAIVIQNEFCHTNLTQNYESIKQFMIKLFGAGRGIEESVHRPANVTVPTNQRMKVDMGNNTVVELINVGTAQSPADLFVKVTQTQGTVWWVGNPFIAESPAIPWLFDGYFLDPVTNLKRIYDMVGDNDVVVPGHGRVTNKAGIKFTIDYVSGLRDNVRKAVNAGYSLAQTQKEVVMPEFNRGYELFEWLHFNFNIPNAYKDISRQNSGK
ncbi:Glyoxylase, beta-lactamase superfamily II [Dyadobacter soli]|uniref:Glyoxylase, beta-lactamase superfamily II n=2 Tax=Dyadobacter soli TaxID=659014 RepID=A0A1G8CQC1_9BACT|nr:Glyoxylase, beta-lactamase superfamily II [Dyadobacter soli]